MSKNFPWLDTHPWLDFRIQSDDLGAQAWVRLGEVASKIRHLRMVPLSPEFRRHLQTVSLVRGTQATTAIEGNTLTDKQIEAIVKGDRSDAIPPSKAYQRQEAENVLEAFNSVVSDLRQAPARPMTPDLLKEWNRLILSGDLPLESHVVPGEYSSVRLVVGRYRALPLNHTDQAMEEFCKFLNEQIDAYTQNEDEEERNLLFAYLAVVAHLFFVWIHPFGDGNGRTARLLEFFICLKGGFPYTAAHLLANHYNQTRSDYYDKLEAASAQHQRGGQAKFVAYAMNGLRDQLVSHIDQVMGELQRVTWKTYVYEALKAKSGDAWDRRRKLVLGMIRQGQSQTARKTIAMDEEVAEAYENTTPRMISQDIADLIKSDLLRPHGEKRKDAILSDILSRYQSGRIAQLKGERQ